MVTSDPCFPFYPTVSVPQIFRRVDPNTIHQIFLSHKIPQSKLVPKHLHTEPSFMTLLMVLEYEEISELKIKLHLICKYNLKKKDNEHNQY